MAARQTGAVRFRFFGPDCEKYVPLGRVLMGALLDRLTIGAGQARMRGEKPDYSGQQTQRLADGTFIRAIWDGTLPIVEIYTRGAQPEEECDVLPDIIGLAVTPWKEDVFDFETEADLPAEANYTNAYTHAAIAGWKVHRPPVDSEMPEDRKRAWFDSTGEHLAEPRRFFDKVTSECGDLTKVHDHILMGNWDWTNGTDTLSCFAGHLVRVSLPGSPVFEAWHGLQRYGASGVDTRVLFRGRVLLNTINLPSPGFVIGHALRHLSTHTELMVIVCAGTTNKLFRVPVRWLTGALHPEAKYEDAEELGSSVYSEDPGLMWSFNQAGTEARRIRGGREDLCTLSGFSDFGEAASGDRDVVGTATEKWGYYVLSPPYLGFPARPTDLEVPRYVLFPSGGGLSGNMAYRTKIGETNYTSGTGVRTVKLAVDFIDNVPEYFYEQRSGGVNVVNDTSNVQLLEYDMYTEDPLNVPTYMRTAVSRARIASYTATVKAFGTTTDGILFSQTETYNETLASSGEGYFYRGHVPLDGGSYGTVREDTFTASSSFSSATNTSGCTILYVDLRSRLIVSERFTRQATYTLSTTVDMRMYGEQTTSTPIREWEPNTKSSSGLQAGTTVRAVHVLHRGEVIWESDSVTENENTPVSTSGPAYEHNEEEHVSVSMHRYGVALDEYAHSYAFSEVDLDTPWPGGGSPTGNYFDYWESGSPVYQSTPNSEIEFEDPPTTTTVWGYPSMSEYAQPFKVDLVPTVPAGTDHPFSVFFGATADDDGNLYFSMPLPVNGWSEDWETVNIFQGTEPLIPEVVGAPETYNFWPMTLIGPAFVSVPQEEE